jgi:hypothetical protein
LSSYYFLGGCLEKNQFRLGLDRLGENNWKNKASSIFGSSFTAAVLRSSAAIWLRIRRLLAA